MIKYIGPLLVVADIAASRRFYEELLGQKVQMDFGVNVSFEGNLAIHQKSHFQSLLGEAGHSPVVDKAHNGEIYFEADEIEAVYQRLSEAGVEFIHGIREQPWAQRVMRLYDPDGHILEIAEQMETTVRRLAGQGWSVDQVGQKTGLPRAYIEQALQAQAENGQGHGE